MKIIGLEEIKALFNQNDALTRLKAGFEAFSAGRVQLPPAQQFAFAQAEGDCCIKSAWIEGSESFCVKISTGFYNNPSLGLPSNDGLNMVFSAQTGQPLVLLNDSGWLTGVRTALAGRIAAEMLLPKRVERIAIFGTGLQAELQLRQLLELTSCRDVFVWGRSEESLSRFREQLSDIDIQLVTTTSEQQAASGASVIVTATPSTKPLVLADWVQPGTHITAVGADTPGKQELDAKLVAKANCIVADSLKQCAAYGELSHLPVEYRENAKVIELGSLLSDRSQCVRGEADITIADLTGLGVQDAQISASILAQLKA
ncbi:NAD(P)-binding domain-containing protein [Enterobacteriaceae bacterium H20N1]|uniref:NAD(P)-binding domain-containing protein n=1 Tax=Dryocola boscaweniae TaxID=2925397 RepID=A0A9X2W6F2_9ENTR|nr:NAD(P)-binding domain-containing protein [Dryocola boscaweniae]MCT4701665.1 NAD(P)-binding domain-containing protein [Dryocola boscaweniae]MCT4718834.1 NAD(P)-binding domain-containing protein [Dryocola boscaweniae]